MHSLWHINDKLHEQKAFLSHLMSNVSQDMYCTVVHCLIKRTNFGKL